ncbi:MAG: hypothetical protein CME88_08705 [Hirschia sp.]|nr:hypothetical protein [Hirschia sp.]MBF18442.1 hypothetical protein [Hirschia sp.]
MPAANQIKVLVVDDQLSMRKLIAGALMQIGFRRIFEENNGKAGLAHATSSPVHLVISDYNMPDMDGLEFLKQLRAHPLAGKTGFIMLTGRADATLVGRARELGVNNYVVKPFTVTHLKAKLEQVIGKLT